MTYQDFINNAVTRYNEQNVTIETLQAAACQANDDLTIDDAVLDAILAALEGRMDTQDFIDFCETL